jgi:succinate dehydrogenase/fumarate reductase-like Fe-S protein
MHRLWRVCWRLSKWIGHALHVSESLASRSFAAVASGTNQPCLKMVQVMDAEGFGNCTNTYECGAVCPAEISATFISKLNREHARAAMQRGAGE